MYPKFWKSSLIYFVGFTIGFIFPILITSIHHYLGISSSYEEQCDSTNPQVKNVFLQSMLLDRGFGMKDNFTFNIWFEKSANESKRLTYDAWMQTKNVKRNKNIDISRYIYAKEDFKETLEADWLKSSIHVTCIVFVEKIKLAKSIAATWGNRCNTLYFFSRNIQDFDLPIINFEIKFTSSWQLLCESMHYVWNMTLKKNDILEWVIFVNDDTMIIPENLRYMVAPLSYDNPYYLGHAVTLWGRTYNIAQSGYVLSKKAFQRMIEASNSTQFCATGGKYWKKEDYDLGKHLSGMDIHPSDTRDEYFRASFHGYSFQNLLLGLPNTGSYWTRAVYPSGLACCSTRSITFHVGDSERMHTLYYILYHLYVYKNGGMYGTEPPKSSISEEDVWRTALKEEFNITATDDISSEEYYRIWHSKYKEPGEFIRKEQKNMSKFVTSL